MQAPPCPRCSEDRLTEVIRTKQRRVAFCQICAHEWPYDAQFCTCAVGGVRPHFHDPTAPICPRCGKTAQMTRPADG